MMNGDPQGLTKRSTEIAGEATVESAPAERDSSDGEIGLDANNERGAQLPGPAYEIGVSQPDAADEKPPD